MNEINWIRQIASGIHPIDLLCSLKHCRQGNCEAQDARPESRAIETPIGTRRAEEARAIPLEEIANGDSLRAEAAATDSAKARCQRFISAGL
jgi:hypothetical protein